MTVCQEWKKSSTDKKAFYVRIFISTLQYLKNGIYLTLRSHNYKCNANLQITQSYININGLEATPSTEKQQLRVKPFNVFFSFYNVIFLASIHDLSLQTLTPTVQGCCEWVCLYLGLPVLGQGVLPGVGGVLPVVQQGWLPVVERRGLLVIHHRGVPVVQRGLPVVRGGLPVVRERGLPDIGLHILPGFYFWPVTEEGAGAQFQGAANHQEYAMHAILRSESQELPGCESAWNKLSQRSKTLKGK